jgi:hypothetical protein
MYRLFFREGSVGRKLLSQVRKDLVDVIKVCEGGLKQTNHLRTLMSALTKGTSVLAYTSIKFSSLLQALSPPIGGVTRSPKEWL